MERLQVGYLINYPQDSTSDSFQGLALIEKLLVLSCSVVEA